MSVLLHTVQKNCWVGRVQRTSVLQPAIRASCSQHVLAHKSFQLAPKPFLISRIDYNPSVIWISPKNSTCPSGKLRTKITSPIAKSTSPGLSDMTFFARWFIGVLFLYMQQGEEFVLSNAFIILKDSLCSEYCFGISFAGIYVSLWFLLFNNQILKATKSPLKSGPLEDLDPNSLDDKGR